MKRDAEGHIVSMTHDEMRDTIGRYILVKYRRLADANSTQAAARNMRKQGFPLGMALMVLARRGGDAR